MSEPTTAPPSAMSRVTDLHRARMQASGAEISADAQALIAQLQAEARDRGWREREPGDEVLCEKFGA